MRPTETLYDEVLKVASEYIDKPVASILADSMRQQTWPKIWISGDIIPLAKKCPCPKCKKGGKSAGACTPKLAGMCTCGTCDECRGVTKTEEV